MRKLLLLAVAFLLLAAPAWADFGTSANVDVTVTVPSIFGFNITAGDLAFASITDPFSNGSEVKGLTYDLDCNDGSGWVVNADFDVTTWDSSLDFQVYDYDDGTPGYNTLTPDGSPRQFDSGGMESYNDGNWNFRLLWTAPVPNDAYVGVCNIIMS